MRRFIPFLVIMLTATMALGVPHAQADDDLPRTFAECVARGGDIRADESDLMCRYVESYDMRTYFSGTTACGEEVFYEIWGETRDGVVTYLFETQPTRDLPETGDESPLPLEDPIPCLDDWD